MKTMFSDLDGSYSPNSPSWAAFPLENLRKTTHWEKAHENVLESHGVAEVDLMKN